MDDLEDALHKLMLHDDAFIESALGYGPGGACGLDPKTLALTRIAGPSLGFDVSPRATRG